MQVTASTLPDCRDFRKGMEPGLRAFWLHLEERCEYVIPTLAGVLLVNPSGRKAKQYP